MNLRRYSVPCYLDNPSCGLQNTNDCDRVLQSSGCAARNHIDTPALTVAADAAALGQMADSVLLVVRPGVVDSVNATFAKELLAKSGQNVLGQVVNGVIFNNERHSYYYFTKEYYAPESANQDEVVRTYE